MDEFDRVFAALASAPRREILARLGVAGLSTTELAAALAISAPAVSRHLSVLEQAGLATSERHGARVLYRLNRDQLLETLTSFAQTLSYVAEPVRKPRESI
jgi:ArsR family transcriptional regulator, arsenate/arsenite/antimonite-responsive transcriptional repressor